TWASTWACCRRRGSRCRSFPSAAAASSRTASRSRSCFASTSKTAACCEGSPHERAATMTATVMITTGGTGGHVFPGLAVAAKLIARGLSVFWLGTSEGFEARLVPQHGIDFEGISFRGVRGKGLRTLLLGPLALLAACVDSLSIMRRRQPSVVLGFGGFASFPGALMCVATARPLVFHDANAVAGLATRILAYGAEPIRSCF